MSRLNKFKVAQWLLSLTYSSLLVYIVFFARRRRGLIWHEEFVNLTPVVNSIRSYQSIPVEGLWDFYSNLFGNILLFVPLPFILIILFRISSRLKLVLIGMGLSLAIECTQYFLRIGIPDIDDVLLNTTGVVVGIVAWMLLFKIKFVRRNRLIHRHSIS